MTTIWVPCADGCPVEWLGNHLQVFGDELISEDGHHIIEHDLRDGFRLCAAVDGPDADWSQAPAWANWWAVDPNGYACWYEEEPVLSLTVSYCGWVPKTIRGVQQGNALWAAELDLALGIDWRLLKHQRPQKGGGE